VKEPGHGHRPALGRQFRIFQTAVISSDLADGVYKIAVPLLALRYPHPAAALSLVGITVRLPWLVTTLPAGMLADRYHPRSVMRWAAGLRLPLVALLCVLAVTGLLPLWALAVAAFVIGGLGNVVDVAAQSLLPRLVGPDQLTRANANLQSAQTFLAQLLGPAVGGWAAGFGAGGGLATAAALYVLAVCSLGMLPVGSMPSDNTAVDGATRRPDPPPVPEQAASGRAGSFRAISAELFEGLGYLRHRADLTRLAATAAANNIAYAMCLTILPLWAVAPGRLHLSTRGYGLLLTCLALGSIGAGLAATRILARTGPGFLMRFGAPLLGVCFLSIAAPSVPVIAAGLFCYGAVSMLWNVVVVTYRQTSIPAPVFGRVNAAYRWVTWGVFPLGSVLAGGLAVVFPVQVVFLTAAAIPLLTGVFLQFRATRAGDVLHVTNA
jgi:hypothetical protein